MKKKNFVSRSTEPLQRIGLDKQSTPNTNPLGKRNQERIENIVCGPLPHIPDISSNTYLDKPTNHDRKARWVKRLGESQLPPSTTRQLNRLAVTQRPGSFRRHLRPRRSDVLIRTHI